MSVRRIRNLVGRSLIAVLLFAQGALALAACDWARRAPALAIAQAHPSAPGAECPMLEQNVNLCVAHCLGEDQSADTPQVVVPAWAGAPPLLVEDVNRIIARATILRYTLPHPGAPPPRILYHSFLI